MFLLMLLVYRDTSAVNPGMRLFISYSFVEITLQPAESPDPRGRSDKLSVDPHGLVTVVSKLVTHIRLARGIWTTRAFHADDVPENRIFSATSAGKIISFKLRNQPATDRDTARCKLIAPASLVDRGFRGKARHFRHVHFLSLAN